MKEAGLNQSCAGGTWKASGQERQLEHRRGSGNVSDILDDSGQNSGESIWEEGGRDQTVPWALTGCPGVKA